MSDFETVNGNVAQLGPLIQQAYSNDLRENLLVIARMGAQAALQPWYSALILADLVMVHGSVQNLYTQIQQHRDWLSASSRSQELLTNASRQWQEIGTRQQAMIEDIRVARRSVRGGVWDSNVQVAHQQDAADQERREAEFAESLARILEGCELSMELTQQIFENAHLNVSSALLNCSAANVPAYAWSGRPRNWRLRQLETQYSRLRSRLSALRAKSSWSSQEATIAQIFRTHSQVLAALQKRIGGGPTTVYAV